MFTVIPRKEFPDWPESNAALDYEWDMDGTNIEWRECVARAVEVLSGKFELKVLDEPEFEPEEDFVDIKYQVGKSELVFSNDALLSMIWLVSEDIVLLRNVENTLGESVGWRE